MNHINNIGQLQQLISNTYIYAIVVAVVAVLVAIIIANLIPWNSDHGKDRSYVPRRVAFFVVWIVSVLGFWLYNAQAVAPAISNAGWRSMFESANYTCLAITAGVYLVLSLLAMVPFRTSKFASVFFTIKSK